jgi:hypothetical protein
LLEEVAASGSLEEAAASGLLEEAAASGSLEEAAASGLLEEAGATFETGVEALASPSALRAEAEAEAAPRNCLGSVTSVLEAEERLDN